MEEKEQPETEPEYYAIDSFYFHFRCWFLMGLDPSIHPKGPEKRYYQIYSVIVFFLVNVYFPMHLLVGLLQQRDFQVILENASMCMVILVCLIKAIDTRKKIQIFRELGEISKGFEKKAKEDEDQYALLLDFKSKCRLYIKSYVYASIILVIFAGLTLVTFDERQLIHGTGYFPYDYTQSRLVYGVTATYQFCAWMVHVFSNIAYDTYPGMFYFLLSQHVQILNTRISKIGYDPGLSLDENHEHLREAIKDHNKIIEFYKTVQETVSLVTFVLFVSTSLNIVTCVVTMTFFAESTFEKMFCVQLGVCFAMETILGCYYGSDFEVHIYKVTSSLYSCNWVEQTKGFKQDLRIFMECSLKDYNFVAGGLIPISKLTFLSMMRGVFSLFTMLSEMN